MWGSGRPLSPDLSELWASGQPDNANEAEHCAEVRIISDTSAEFNFNDLTCDGSHGQIRNFVCQKRSTNTDLMEAPEHEFLVDLSEHLVKPGLYFVCQFLHCCVDCLPILYEIPL